MTSIDLGASVKVRWPDAPAAGSTVALAVVRPDGSQLAPAPTVTGTATGSEATITPTMPGRHLLRWTSSGAVVDAHTDVVDVWPSDPRFIFPPDQAKDSLNWANPKASDVDDLRLYVAAATPVIEDIVGPVVRSSEVFTAPGGSFVMLPVVSATVTSVKVNGAQVTDYYADPAGAVSAGNQQVRRAFPSGLVEVQYTVGMQVIPPNIQLAARELVRHMWQIGRQAIGRSGRQDPTAEAYTPSGFAVPRRVIELCAPHQKVGGFA